MNRPEPTDPETEWSKWLACQMYGEAEVQTQCGSRCDVVTESHAYEVEWIKKWSQAPGQAVLYALLLGKKPGVVLLSRNKSTEKHYYLRCFTVCRELDIDLRVQRTRGK